MSMSEREIILSEISSEARTAHAISVACDGDESDFDLAGLMVLRDLDKGLIKPSEINDTLRAYEAKGLGNE